MKKRFPQPLRLPPLRHLSLSVCSDTGNEGEVMDRGKKNMTVADLKARITSKKALPENWPRRVMAPKIFPNRRPPIRRSSLSRLPPVARKPASRQNLSWRWPPRKQRRVTERFNSSLGHHRRATPDLKEKPALSPSKEVRERRRGRMKVASRNPGGRIPRSRSFHRQLSTARLQPRETQRQPRSEGLFEKPPAILPPYRGGTKNSICG